MKVMARKYKLSVCVKLMPKHPLISEAFLREVDIGEFLFCIYMIAESLETGEIGEHLRKRVGFGAVGGYSFTQWKPV